jgi:hypothetical protein
MDFMFTVPPDYRVDKTLYKHMVSVRYPELFSIPTKNTFGLPLASSRTRILLRRIMLGSLTRINRISTKIMKRNLFLDPLENYVDYDDLIRIDKTYRSFVKKHLDQVKCYPYFDAIGIDRIWENHLSGRGNYAYLFGLLVSFDLLMKHYISTGKNDGILKIDEEIVEER